MTSAAIYAKSALGRADLLRVLAGHGERALAQFAAVLGYARVGSAVEVDVPPGRVDLKTSQLHVQIGPEPPTPIAPPAVLPAARFFAVTACEQASPGRETPEEAPPEWFEDARALSEDSRPDPGTVRIPARLPLTRWSRLWPFLRRALSQGVFSREPDIPRLVRRLSRGEFVRAVPLRQRHDWSPRVCMLVDYNRHSQPFRDDYNALRKALARRHGAVGLDLRILHGEPGRAPLYRRPYEHALQRWQMPGQSVPLLILSDLGMLEGGPETLRAWHRFGCRVKAVGLDAAVLAPVPAARHERLLQRGFSIFEWDRHSRLRAGPPRPTSIRPASVEAAEMLLALLAPAVSVEPALLRAMRYLLPASQADVGAEAAVWQHADVVANTQGLHFASLAAIEKYRERFRGLDPALQRAAVRLIRAYHAGLPESVRLSELGVCERLVPGSIEAQALNEVEAWGRNIVKTCYQRPDATALVDWLARYAARQSLPEVAAQPELAALWALDKRAQLMRGEALELPPGMRQEDVAYFLRGGDPVSPTPCVLRQCGEALLLERMEGKVARSASSEDPIAGSPVARFALAEEGVFVEEPCSEDVAGAQWRFVPVVSLPQPLARMDQQAQAIKIHGVREQLTITSLTRPSWARAIGRDAQGLFVEAEWLGAARRMVWQAAQPGQPGQWAGGDSLGVDECGLYADLEVEGVTQRFRWIAPGSFMMGSPESEPERWEDERQHEVTLSQGFWLADTACTQALWQAVMGANPSEFKDDPRNPVEQVSWEDAQRFISRLNERVPGLQARLPSEAQWEYACRAGTATPFSFGENITPEQVNYDGGKKGLSRGRTVPVGSLPPNPWGLYEMHGNVWEWCEDWFGEYAGEAQVDPRGPGSGADRVLRGGSWFHNGGHCRSAYRSRNEPAYRVYDFGLRLARGPGASPAGQAAGEERPAGQPRGRRGGQAGRGTTSAKSKKTK